MKVFKEIINGIIPALPFGNVIAEIKNNIKDNSYTPKGSINWPKLIMYIITGLIVLGQLLGVITTRTLWN